MRDAQALHQILERIDGRGYNAYRDIEGRWHLGGVDLFVDRVQGDPFAAPSRLRLRVDRTLPEHIQDADARLAAEDWLLRRFAAALHPIDRGSGRSGALRVVSHGPEVVARTAVRLTDSAIEVRLRAGLPARGRRVLGRQAAAMLLEDLPAAAATLGPGPGLEAHVASIVRQRALRRQLRSRGLVAFIPDGAILPRRSGVTQAPLADALAFLAPPSLRVHLDGPDGPVSGMGIPAGVTVIVGGGFHGKSTLLNALASGVVDHIPGDGREGVVADPDTVKVRAEDGRAVRSVDISAFLGDLPGGRTTTRFTTDDASGSTSQASAIVEALEAGARVLLLDEDTSATNLLVRDERMRALIPDHLEPITPLVERVRHLYERHGVSTVAVVGGTGDLLSVADTVIAMEAFRPRDVTARARTIAGPPPAARAWALPTPRVPRTHGLSPRTVKTRDERRVRFGETDLELGAVEQIRDAPHAASVAAAIRFLGAHLVDGTRAIPTLLDALDAILDDEGLEVLGDRPWPDGELVRPRRHEVAAALSRLRTLTIAESTRPGRRGPPQA